ncbi:MAG: glycine--tRNA ligase subunit beta [Nitrospirae bacterium]|nr:glycine--tRNA ligase subunit beta [Nitrospirota bacterium]
MNNSSLVTHHSSLLLEVGTEEIPARFVLGGVKQLRDVLEKFLTDAGIDFGEAFEYATPRRLAVIIKNVSDKQKDRVTEVVGPPKKAAFDAAGNPTPAAIGFARSCKIDVKNLMTIKTERGEYVAATIEEKGRMTNDVLSESLPLLITSLQFPKSMRWGSQSLRFVRPIRWVTAVLGGDVIAFEIDGIKSSDMSHGHRFISPFPFEVKDPLMYVALLSDKYVLADYNERKETILNEIKKIEAAHGCRVHEDKELLDLVTFLVEYPTVILGEFDRKYLSLPKELLITVMRSHQKYFSIEDKDGNLMPNFIVVSNIKAENSDIVKKGAERVLRARLEDARFYYEEDRKHPLWDYVEKLRKVTFHEKLGNIYEKAERTAFLCSFISEKLNLQSKEKLLKAVMLCKADLVTGVVREFPELQGYMGMIYAENSGEDKDIASAIYEHYMPRFSGDTLPSGEMGSIISLADKIDSIASFFLLGLSPTGSEDPFALRRQAMGVINILMKKDIPIPLDILIDKALQSLEGYSPSIKSLTEEVMRFFYQRFEGMLSSDGYSHDVIDAVFSTKGRDIKDIAGRVDALSEFKEMPEFPALLMAAKRVYNILAKAGKGILKEDSLTEDAEKGIYKAAAKVKESLKEGSYTALFDLTLPINLFFDRVMVMDKDPEVKANRLALLSFVRDMFNMLGYFSRLAG